MPISKLLPTPEKQDDFLNVTVPVPTWEQQVILYLLKILLLCFLEAESFDNRLELVGDTLKRALWIQSNSRS